MKILVDADACPVIKKVEKIAKRNNIKVILLSDTNHELTSNYSTIIKVSPGMDATDFKIVSMCEKNDIVVTQDYGLAALILSKHGHPIHQSGKIYTNENIDYMLMSRYITKRNKAKGIKTRSGGKKAKKRQTYDYDFEESLTKLIKESTQKEITI